MMPWWGAFWWCWLPAPVVELGHAPLLSGRSVLQEAGVLECLFFTNFPCGIEVWQNWWAMEDFSIKESVVGMKEAMQTQAVDWTLCSQNTLLLVSRLPLILNIFFQTYFINACKRCENQIQFHFKNVHKPNVMLVVSFVWLPLTSASWEMFYLAAIWFWGQKVKFPSCAWCFFIRNANTLDEHCPKSHLGSPLVFKLCRPRPTVHACYLLKCIYIEAIWDQINRFLDVKNSISLVPEWHWPARIKDKMPLGLIFYFLIYWWVMLFVVPTGSWVVGVQGGFFT